MRVAIKGIPFNTSGVQAFTKLISNGSDKSADALVQHVISLGAVYALVEEPYTDKDYSADYVHFYASAFRDYSRQTKRIHLFGEDISSALQQPLDEWSNGLNEKAYLGFIVIRPISQAPIGRTILAFPSFGAGLTVRPAARADFKVHLLGTQLKLQCAAPFIQQEGRLGACAQAAIWMASRAVHERHRHAGWHSIAEITRLATTPTDMELSKALPAGSDGLNPVHIIRALRGMGHQPLFDLFMDESGTLLPENGPEKLASVVRYLDSGLPVLIAMANVGKNSGHAVTAIGFVEGSGNPRSGIQTYDAFVRGILVHDDQRGPYRIMPLSEADIAALPPDRLLKDRDKILTVEGDVTHIFVPLPQRVLLRADTADIVARDFVEQFLEAALPGLEKLDMPDLTKAVTGLKAFKAQFQKGQIVRRTYLTSAGRYRHHLLKSNLAAAVKDELIDRVLPHFVWVTELMEPQSDSSESGEPRNIVGHLVTNATSSDDPDSDLLIAHLPHIVVHRDVNEWDMIENHPKQELRFFDAHQPYRGRKRN